MTKTVEKKQSAPVAKAEQAANEFALQGFNRAAFRKAMQAIGGAHDAETASKAERSNAALDLVTLAWDFAGKNSEATSETIAKGFRAFVDVELPALAKAGNRYVEITAATKDKPAAYRLTGYGNNVVSTAKGLCEFGIALDSMPVLDDSGAIDREAEPKAAESYRDVERLVKAYRAEKRAKADPDAELMRVAKAEADEAYRALRELCVDTGDVGIVEALRDALNAQFANVEAQLAEQDAVEAEAEAEAKAA